MTNATPLERELALEQTHVDLVYSNLIVATASARQVAADGASRYQSDRESYVREEDGTALFERDAFAFQAARRLAILDAEHEGLVFGKLDSVAEDVRYIGRIGVRDPDFEPLVIDWRAPAAEPFYRATPTSPMGVVRRRVLRCRDDLVIGIEDDLLDADAAPPDMVVIGEGALMAALTRARGHQMRDIVATIQAEQDEAIRAPYAGVTVIAGGPGTGKTVVGLHRTAYLLYSNRRRFENGGVLVVGPSPVFMTYIERVLPSLGEDSVTLRSLGQIPSDVLVLPPISRTDEADAAVVKGSLRMVPVLRRLVALPRDDVDLLAVSVKGEALLLRSEELNRIRQNVLATHQLNRSRGDAETALISALWRKAPDDLDVDDFDHFEKLIRDSSAFERFVAQWWAPLSAPDALRRLADPAVVASVAGSELSRADQAALAESYQQADWSIADVALLDELVAQLGPEPRSEEGPDLFGGDVEYNEIVTTADRLRDDRDLDSEDPHSTYAHVLIDEAQDVTPMQWRMLRRRGAQASWTVVGDPAQSSWPDVAETQRALTDLIGSAPSRTFRLSTNYRSPAEVFDLAARVIVRDFPDADLPVAVRSTGSDPLLLVIPSADLADQIRSAVTTLLSQVQGTVGVIVPQRHHALVSDVVAQMADERIAVLTPLEVKGLEHDGVLVVDADGIVAESAGGIRVLYVALTRATHRMVVMDLDAPGAWRPAPLG
ncbi:MAG TPA: AAA family ATPase [Propionibacteriaceae bacterium]|nr:AAA family ATPase [Propionibacteriaceae bacterium]